MQELSGNKTDSSIGKLVYKNSSWDPDEPTQFETNIVTELKKIYDELKTMPDIPISYKSQEEVNHLESIDNEFKKLTHKQFIQTANAGACRLYSALWAIHQNESLRKELCERIKKNDKAYYIKVFSDEGWMEITTDYINNAKETNQDLHQSSSDLIIAIGVYVLEHFMKNNGIQDTQAYQITFDGKDTFFDKKIDVIDNKKQEVIFSDSGNIIAFDHTGQRFLYQGDFFISTGHGSHATSIYFDQKNKKWKHFDNQDRNSHIQDLDVENFNDKDKHDFIVIGEFKKESFSKIDKIITEYAGINGGKFNPSTKKAKENLTRFRKQIAEKGFDLDNLIEGINIAIKNANDQYAINLEVLKQIAQEHK